MTTIQASTRVSTKAALLGMQARDVRCEVRRYNPDTKETETFFNDLASLAKDNVVELRNGWPEPANDKILSPRANGKAQPSWFARAYTDMDGRLVVE